MKLRNTITEMVDTYTRQLELRDQTIHRLESEAPGNNDNRELMALRQECDDYKHSNLILRDKVSALTREVDQINKGSGSRH